MPAEPGSASNEPVAVVGVGLRFPGGNRTLDGFDEFLRAGGNGIRPVTADRWDTAAFSSDDPEAKGVIRSAGCGFLDDVDQFDAPFFGVSPLEAQYTDPQQRLLLETTWEALENANINPAPLRHRDGGVYLGASAIDYALEMESLEYEQLDGHLAAGVSLFPMSGRLSYFLGWRGPSLTLDTACASSLTALHLAVQGLRRGECGIALAGAVSVITHPRILVIFTHGNMLAPDGQCKTFDESADGYVRSEGCGVLILKRLSDALRDGNRVHAVIRGTAIGQDGESAGLTVPNGLAQEGVMLGALADAGLGPADIQYVEAHGTGTALGDPIEMGAITEVFGAAHTAEHPLTVASLKTNLGHMEPVAGIGSVVKAIISMRTRTLYPHLHLKNPSGRIPWDAIPVTVPTECTPWVAEKRRALVNSFGFAGGIASTVIEEPPPLAAGPAAPAGDGAPVLTVSAKSKRSLRMLLDRYKEFLATHPEATVDDICYTANVGRSHFPLRVAGVAGDRDDLRTLLDRQAARVDAGEVVAGDFRKAAFLFTGQGSQYPGMGSALYRQFPVFRQHVDECDRLFAAKLGRSVRQLMLGDAGDPGALDQTRYTQPALFTLEYALAKLWLSWGIRPNVLIGHSIGEVVAAAVAGLFRLDDAVALVAARARAMQSASAPGGMLAVPAPVADLAGVLDGYPDLSVAAVNSPRQCVVSGGLDSLAEVEAVLAGRGVSTRRLAVSHAFHSPLMAEVAEQFRAEITGITYHEPALTVVSCLTGAVARPADLSTADYWVRHIRETVNFEAGVRTIDRRGRHVFIEVGPSGALGALARQCVDAGAHRWLRSLHSGDVDGAAVRDAVAQVYLAGLPLSWTGFHSGRERQLLELPPYAFDRKRYWLPHRGKRHGLGGPLGQARVSHPLLGEEVPTAGGREFSARLRAGSPAYLADHVVQGKVVFPGTGYLETLLALQDAVYGDTRRPVVDLRVREPLFLTDEETEVRTRLRPGEDGRSFVEIVSLVRGEGEALERVHVTASFGEPEPDHALSEAGRALCAAAGTAQASEPDEVLGEEEIYAAYHGGGLQYGPEFRRMPQVARYGLNLAVGELRGWPAGALEHVAPPLADSATHAFAAIGNDGNSYLPVRYARFRVFKKPRAQLLRVLLRIDPASQSDVDISIDLVAMEGDQPVFELRGLGIKRVADPAGVRQSLVNELRWLKRSLVGSGRADAGAHRVLVVTAGTEAPGSLAGQAGAAGVTLSVASTTDQVAAALREGQVTDVCWVWQGGPGSGGQTAAALRAECERNYRSVLDLLGLLGPEGPGRGQRLWLVTERGQLVPGDEPPPAPPASATLWGFGHSLLNEQPALRATLVDLSSGADWAMLFAELGARGGGDFQIAYRNGRRYTRRLVPIEDGGRAGGTDPDGNFELAIAEYGQFANIRAVPVPDERPAGDQVLVEVHAAGLNFKDVLNALGLLREFGEQPLGFEAAGTVVAVGPAATHRAGDQVVVNYLGCLRRRVMVPSALAVPKPANVTFTEAAGLPAAYVTAHYALHTLAGMKAGDKVLIHAAAGGVGQAAVQLARAAGAEVFATASPHKWPLLRAQGVRHLMHSRTLDFADEILRDTGGSGVDIVLNSLNKDFIPASFRCLGTGGRFVEMGKVGAWTPEQVRAGSGPGGSGTARPDVAYHNFDLSELPWDEGVRTTSEILRTVVGRVSAGELSPVPTTGYSLDEVEEAFGALSRGTNIGKLVLTFIADDAPAARPVTVDAGHTYVVTGGLGALGLLTAQRLVDLGARHLTLVGRGAEPAPEVAPLAKRLRDRAEVTVLQGDVADPDDMDRIVAALTAAGRPVGGIVHAAGSLADAPVSAQTWQSIDAVCGPKVYGSWLLHQASRSFPDLQFFIGYSSAASVIGAPGQSNYAAANAFLDTLCRWRAANGMPALSINWGPWGSVGMSARATEQVRKRWSEEGISLITPAAGMRALVSLLDSPLPQVVVGAGDWARFAATRPISNALYQRLAARDGGPAGAGIDLAALVAAPRRDRMATIDEFIRGKVAQVLHFDDAGAVDSGTEFIRLGLDSLVAVELKNSLESAFGLPLPGSVALDYPSAELLTEFLDRQLVPEPVGSAA